jgi:hypothetical protein
MQHLPRAQYLTGPVHHDNAVGACVGDIQELIISYQEILGTVEAGKRWNNFNIGSVRHSGLTIGRKAGLRVAGSQQSRANQQDPTGVFEQNLHEFKM